MPIIVPLSSDSSQVQCEVEFCNSNRADAWVQCDGHQDHIMGAASDARTKWANETLGNFIEAGDASSSHLETSDDAFSRELLSDGDTSRLIPLNIVEEKDECIGTSNPHEHSSSKSIWNKGFFARGTGGPPGKEQHFLSQICDYAIVVAFLYFLYVSVA